MALSYDLISQFAKLSKEEKRGSVESTVYGTVKVDGNGNKYVKLDGTDQLTPVTEENQPGIYSTLVNAKDGERVSVLIKDHTATVTGNVSSPSATTGDVTKVENYFKKLIADEATLGKLTAAEANITELIAKSAEIDNLLAGKATITDLIAKKIDTDLIVSDEAVVESLKASNADILSLIAERAVIDRLIAEKITVNDLIAKKIDADLVVADDAVIERLNAKSIDVLTLFADEATVERLFADEANLKQLIAEDVDIKYANIDFTNIGEAAINNFYAVSGIIDRVEISEGVFTKELVGVTISGDLLKANTLMVDQLVVRGSDGNYYKLSTDFSTLPGVTPIEADLVHGSNIVANSITAEKISVDDISAFGGRIGGFGLTHKSLHSLAKDSVENSNPGIYMDSDSQFAVGNMYNYIKFYKVLDGDGNEVLDENGQPTYKLAISADTILFGNDSKTELSDVKDLTEHVKIGRYTETAMYGVSHDESTGAYVTGDVIIKNVIAENIAASKVDGVYTTEGHDVYHADKDMVGYEYVCFISDTTPCVKLAEGDSDFKQVITNVKTMFMDGEVVKTTIDTDGVATDNLRINQQIDHAGFVWAGRTNGNYGLSWKG